MGLDYPNRLKRFKKLKFNNIILKLGGKINLSYEDIEFRTDILDSLEEVNVDYYGLKKVLVGKDVEYFSQFKNEVDIEIIL